MITLPIYLPKCIGTSISYVDCLGFFPKMPLQPFTKPTILPSFDYCDVVWHSCSQECSNRLERLQNYAGRVILKEPKSTSATWIRSVLGWDTLSSRRETHVAIQVYKSLNGLDPGYLAPLLTQSSSVHNHHTRAVANNTLHLPIVRTNFGKKAFDFIGAKIWNSLPSETRHLKSLKAFIVHVRSRF